MAAVAMLPHVEQLFAEWMPDIVLRDPCEYASAIVASRHGIPAAQAAIPLAEVEAGSLDVAARSAVIVQQQVPYPRRQESAEQVRQRHGL